MATRHTELLEAGTRVFGVSVDSPAQQSAMIDKLRLPFPLLSDPDRSAAIGPLGLRDEEHPDGIARPALVLIGPGGAEVWRTVSRDFADRLPEDDVIQRVQEAGWAATSQEPPTLGPCQPGERAMPVGKLDPYFRGARFAALAMGKRHRGLGEEIANDSKAYVAEMDRFIAAVKGLKARS